jgi:glycosyltransferase involved in cell wall biosynthesis
MTRRPARICHVITMLELGGAQQNTLYTVRNLDRSRFDPILVTGTEGPLVEEARTCGARAVFLSSLVRPISPLRDGRALVDLMRLFRRERPDVVHTHSSKAGILGRLAAAAAGVPVIVHSIHGWGFHPGQGTVTFRLFVALERLAARSTTAFIAVSRANARQGEALGILQGHSVRLIRSGIRLQEFHPGNGSFPAGDAKGATVGMVACLKPQKMPLDFVRIAAEVVREEPRTRFILVGDGELRSEVEGAIRRHGLESSVRLVGWRRDVPELMRSFDVLLHTSRWEGLPRVFPEAMATGLPIVATRVDGAPEAIEEGVTGRLFEPGDVAGMAHAVVELIRDRELRRRMGSAGLDRVDEWDIDAMVRAQQDLYDELLG